MVLLLEVCSAYSLVLRALFTALVNIRAVCSNNPVDGN